MNTQKLVLTFRTFLAELIRWVQCPPSKPGAFTIEVTGEIAMKNITIITLPVLADGNPQGVVTRRFSVTNTEGVLHSQDYTVPEGAVNVDPITVKIPQDLETVLSLVDVDAAGNASPADVFTFTPTDVTPPSMPGAFSVTVSGEEA